MLSVNTRRKRVSPIGALSAAMNAVRLAQQAYNVGQQLGGGVNRLRAQSTAQGPTGVGPNATQPRSRNRRRRRRQQMGPDQSQTVSPQTVGTVRRTTIPRQVQSGEVMTISGRESLGFLKGSASPVVYLPMRPNRFVSLKTESDSWQEFRFLQLRVWYEPGSITTDKGSILLSPFYRQLAKPADQYSWRSLSVTPGSVTGPIWAKNEMVINFDVSRSQHLWYDTSLVLSDPSRSTPFYLMAKLLGVAEGLEVGQLMVEYVVQFAHRDPPGDAQNVDLGDVIGNFEDGDGEKPDPDPDDGDPSPDPGTQSVNPIEDEEEDEDEDSSLPTLRQRSKRGAH